MATKKKPAAHVDRSGRTDSIIVEVNGEVAGGLKGPDPAQWPTQAMTPVDDPAHPSNTKGPGPEWG
jgi:hypothetical protein